MVVNSGNEEIYIDCFNCIVYMLQERWQLCGEILAILCRGIS